MTSLFTAGAFTLLGAPACTGIMGDPYTLLEPKELGPCNPYSPEDCPSGTVCDSEICVKPCPENDCGATWCNTTSHTCAVPVGTPCEEAGASGCGRSGECLDRDAKGLPTSLYCSMYPYNMPARACPAGFVQQGDFDYCLKP